MQALFKQKVRVNPEMCLAIIIPQHDQYILLCSTDTNLVPRALDTLIQRNGKTKTSFSFPLDKGNEGSGNEIDRVIVDEDETRVNYRALEIESE